MAMPNTNVTKTEAPKITPKQQALIEELAAELHIKPDSVITKALELLKKVEENHRLFFDVEQKGQPEWISWWILDT